MNRPGLYLLAGLLFGAAATQIVGSQQRAPDESFQSAMRLERAGDHKRALNMYRRLVDEYPDNQRYFRQLRNLLASRQEHAEVIQLTRDYLQAHPSDLRVWVDLGGDYLAAGDESQAVETWALVLERFRGNQTGERLVLTRMFTANLFEQGALVLQQLRLEKGDSTFFAQTMGRLFASRMSYDLATDEYLLHLAANPVAEQGITNQIMRYPIEDELLQMLREKLTASGNPAALRILINVEFRYRQFDRVVVLAQTAVMSEQQLLALGEDLAAEGEFEPAVQLVEQVLSSAAQIQTVERGILTLAEIYLSRAGGAHPTLVHSGFFPNNRFFRTPFTTVSDSMLTTLARAMTLYDSLATSARNLEAFLRLADIKYRILDDFDGALADYRALAITRQAVNQRSSILLRMVDVQLARGDLAAAGENLQQAAKAARNSEQLNAVELMEIELLYLTGDIDSLVAESGGLMAEIGPGNRAFNDLMEINTLVDRLREEPLLLDLFLRSERLLRRNRRSEAIQLLSEGAGQERDGAVILQYRLAYLTAMQRDYPEAIELALAIRSDEELGEKGVLLAAEIADYLQQDAQFASENYLAFMSTYPLSIHHDVVRLRYRELNPGSD